MASGTLTKDVILNLKIDDQQAVTNIADLTRHLDELKAKQIVLNGQQVKLVEDLNKKLKEGKITEEEYAAALQKKYVEIAKNDAAIKETKRSISAYQKELQNNLVAEKAEKNSLDAMRAQLLNMKKAYDALSEVERNTDDGQKRQKNIEELTQKIKDLEAAQLDFRRNVGNYPETTQSAKQALREMTIECQNLAVALSQTEGQIQAQNTQLQTLAATLGTDSQEYKDAAAELQRMNDEYETSKQKLNEMTVEAGKLKDTIGDVSQSINSFANDQQKIAAMQEGVSVLTSAYTVLQGSMAALGIESKSLLEVYAKIQIVQQSVNALMTIYKALNKESNLMIVARQKIEQARLVWTKAYNKALEEQNKDIVKNTVAEGANAAATTATTVAEGAATAATFSFKAALEALKATLLSNPLTAIALAITAAALAIGKAVSKIVKKNKEAKESEEELAEATRKTSEEYKKSVDKRVSAINSATKTYTEQIAKVKALLAVIQSESSAYTAKKKAVYELNKIVPEYNAQLSQTGQIIRANTSAVDKYIDGLERQAQATAIMNALINAEEEKLETERRKREDERNKRYFERQIENNQQMRDAAESVGDYETVAKADKYLEYYRKKLEAVNKDLQEVNNLWKSANNEVKYYANMAKDLPVPESTPKSSGSGQNNDTDIVSEAQAQYDEMLKIANNYYKELDKMANDSVQTLTEKENLRYQGERNQLQTALDDAQKLYDQLSKDPKLLKELQKKNKYLSLETLQKQITMLFGELDNVESKHKNNLEKITTDTEAAFNNILKKLQLDLDLASSDETTRMKAQLQQRLDALDAELENELKAHEYTEEQKLAITEMYEKRKQQVRNEYINKSQAKSNEGDYSNSNSVSQVKAQLASDIAALEARRDAELAIFKGTEEEKAKIVKKYADMRVQYEQNASKQEAKIWGQATLRIADALAATMGNMSDLFNALAEDDEKMNDYSKALAMGQIILSSAVATAQAVVAAINFGSQTGLGAAVAIPLALVEFLGIVAGVIAQAKSILKTSNNTSKPKFAEGGLVGTRTTNKTDDKIDAKLSEGEYVIKSKVVEKYGVEFFDYLNYGRKVTHSQKTSYADGGVVSQIPQNIIQQTEQQSFSMDEFRNAITDAISEMPSPVVSVKEVTNVQKRVKVKENLSKAK